MIWHTVTVTIRATFILRWPPLIRTGILTIRKAIVICIISTTINIAIIEWTRIVFIAETITIIVVITGITPLIMIGVIGTRVFAIWYTITVGIGFLNRATFIRTWLPWTSVVPVVPTIIIFVVIALVTNVIILVVGIPRTGILVIGDAIAITIWFLSRATFFGALFPGASIRPVIPTITVFVVVTLITNVIMLVVGVKWTGVLVIGDAIAIAIWFFYRATTIT